MADERLRSKGEIKRLFTNLHRKGISDDMMSILVDALWRDNTSPRTSGFDFPGGDGSVIDFDNTTRTFTIKPHDPLIAGWLPRYAFFSLTNKASYFRRFETETIVIPDEEGLYVVFFDKGADSRLIDLTFLKNPTDSQLEDLYTKKVIVSFIYWNATASEAIYFGDDRHGSEINPQQHWINHRTIHAQKEAGGLDITGMLINKDGSLDSHARFTVTAGDFWHDDFLINVPSDLGGTNSIPILYFSGANNYPRFVSQTGFQIYNSGRVCYNSTATEIVEATDGYYIAYHCFAVNDKISGQQVISVMGLNQYEKLASLNAEIPNEVNSIRSLMPQQGQCYLGSVLIQTSDSFTNTVKARLAGFAGDAFTKSHPFVTIDSASQDILSIDENQELSFIDVLEVFLDFETVEAFTYTCPYDMKFTSIEHEQVSTPTLSVALNTAMDQYDDLVITPDAVGLVTLKAIKL